MTERPRRVFEYGAFQQPTSPLFRDYLAGAPAVAPFYDGGGWDLPALVRSADATRRLARPREAVADSLARQQQSRGAAAAADRASLLRKPETVAVVTGQQAGLFGGPLYVLYKALGALKTARLLEAQGRPAVAVFWVAADDHDFAEVRSASPWASPHGRSRWTRR
jgi:bacillithiol synthase